jgi:hypothetical protein
VLIGSQALIVGLLFKVCLDFVRGHGVFVAPNPRFARFVVPLGRLYFLAMVVRYVVRMSLYPEARWLGGTIPIFFHWVLASYLMAFGRFHRTQLAQSGAASPRSSGMAAAEIPREAREEGICR